MTQEAHCEAPRYEARTVLQRGGACWAANSRLT